MNRLTRPKRSPKNHPVAAFDVETIGPDRKFVCGCFQDAGGQFFTRSREALAARLLDAQNAGSIIYATNLFYDYTAVFGGFPSPGKALFAGARLIRVHHPVPGKRIIRFYDTSNLTSRMSVSYLGKMVGLAKLDTPPVLIDPHKAHLTPANLPPVRMAEIEEYNRMDTAITYNWALRFQEVAKSLGCEVKATIASTALDLWKRNYMTAGLQTPSKWLNEWFRDAYHGGLVFVFQRGLAKGVTYYDIRSLYPFVLANRCYPDVSSIRFLRTKGKLAHIMDSEGFSRVTVDYPDCYFPILPIVVRGCLLTCTGRYSGLWTHVELREAIKRGATITAIHDQVYFTRTITPLKSYMQELYDKRLASAQAGDGFEGVYKLFMNALSGKFGQRYDGSLYEPVDVDGIRSIEGLKGLVTVECGTIEYFIRPLKQTYTPTFVNVAWAAYMTAYARLHEIHYLEEAFPNVYACDTDSVFTTHPYTVGPWLGDMGLKEEARDWVYLFPKQYASWDSSNRWSGKVKGVPVVGQADYIREGVYTWTKPATFKEAVKEGVVPGDWIERTRTDRPKHDKRVYLEDVDPFSDLTNSRPFTYEEALAHFSQRPVGGDWRRTGNLPATSNMAELRMRSVPELKEAYIGALRESCTIPAPTILALWDYKKGAMRPVRSLSGVLTTWEYSKVDSLATEHGYPTAGAFVDAIRDQVAVYARIRELEAS